MANKNKAFNYADIAKEFETNIHTAREIVRGLRKEGKVLVKYLSETRKVEFRVGLKEVKQKIAYITINRRWLNKHREKVNESEADV